MNIDTIKTKMKNEKASTYMYIYLFIINKADITYYYLKLTRYIPIYI